MPRTCLLGDPYEVVETPLGPTIKEVGNGKLVRYGFGSEEDAKTYCKMLNEKAFIEEERYWQNKLDYENNSSNNDEE